METSWDLLTGYLVGVSVNRESNKKLLKLKEHHIRDDFTERCYIKVNTTNPDT